MENKKAKELFKDLTIEYKGAESPIHKLDGTIYEVKNRESLTLKGEEAYKFLVCLNREDKEFGKLQEQGDYGYSKTWVRIRYDDIDIDDRFDLGDLEFNNEKMIAKGIRNHLITRYIYLLNHPEYAMASDLNKEKIYEIIREIHKITGRLAKEEKEYLKTHPEIKAINDKQVKGFYYICRRNDFNEIAKKTVILGKYPIKNFKNFFVVNPASHYLIYEYLEEPRIQKFSKEINKYEHLPDEYMVFKTHRSPCFMYTEDERRRKVPCRFKILIPEEDMKTMEKLKNLYFVTTESKGQPSLETGIFAVHSLESMVRKDSEKYYNSVTRKYHIPDSRLFKGELYYNKRKILTINDFYIGSGKLSNKICRLMLKTKKLIPDNQLLESYRLFKRYTHTLDYCHQLSEKDMKNILQDQKEKLPDKETSLKTIESQKPNRKEYTTNTYSDWMTDAIEYYDNIGAIKAPTSGLDALYEESVKAMIEDGYNIRQIKAIAKRSYTASFINTANRLLSLPEMKKKIKEVQKALKTKRA